MKLTNARGKLSRVGFTIEVDNPALFNQGWVARLPDSEHVIEITTQGDRVSTIRSKRERDKDDSMTDYFPGTWHPNLTQAIESVLRATNRAKAQPIA